MRNKTRSYKELSHGDEELLSGLNLRPTLEEVWADADAGDPKAQYLYGKIFLDGDVVEKDVPHALGWLELAASNGSADAVAELGNCFTKGIGVEKDPVRGLELSANAAAQGSALGQIQTGAAYLIGDVVSEDHRKAFKLFKQAAGQGEATAALQVALCYLHGTGVARDPSEAFMRAADLAVSGFCPAQTVLAQIYANGEGTRADTEVQNARKSFLWYKRAAEAGEAAAQNNLAFCYGTGSGVPEDFKKAVFWLYQAAQQDFAPAQFSLGYSYLVGELGLPVDVDKARGWVEKAAAKEYERAVDCLRDEIPGRRSSFTAIGYCPSDDNPNEATLVIASVKYDHKKPEHTDYVAHYLRISRPEIKTDFDDDADYESSFVSSKNNVPKHPNAFRSHRPRERKALRPISHCPLRNTYHAQPT